MSQHGDRAVVLARVSVQLDTHPLPLRARTVNEEYRKPLTCLDQGRTGPSGARYALHESQIAQPHCIECRQRLAGLRTQRQKCGEPNVTKLDAARAHVLRAAAWLARLRGVKILVSSFNGVCTLPPAADQSIFQIEKTQTGSL